MKKPGDLPICIVGGGIAGLALALALKALGKKCVILERENEFGNSGAGLLLAPNAVWVLSQLGVLDDLERHCVRTPLWHLLDQRGRVLQQVTPCCDGVPAISTTRLALQNCLLRHLDPSVFGFGKEVVAVKESADGVDLETKQGEEFRTGLVVGADGLRSTVRRTQFADEPPVYRGYLGWRGLVRWIPDRWQEGLVSESWGIGSRFGIAPIDHETCYWYATTNQLSPSTGRPEQKKETLLSNFSDWHDPVRELIERTENESILEAPIFDRPMRFRWSTSRTTLIGDAAHPMTPNLGQGTGMALEDAWCLARLLGEDRPLHHFDRARWARKARLLWQSRLIGTLIQISQPAIAHLRDNVMRWSPAAFTDAGLRPIFDFRI